MKNAASPGADFSQQMEEINRTAYQRWHDESEGITPTSHSGNTDGSGPNERLMSDYIKRALHPSKADARSAGEHTEYRNRDIEKERKAMAERMEECWKLISKAPPSEEQSALYMDYMKIVQMNIRKARKSESDAVPIFEFFDKRNALLDVLSEKINNLLNKKK